MFIKTPWHRNQGRVSWVQWFTLVSSVLCGGAGGAKAGGLLEPTSLRPGWATWDLVSTKIKLGMVAHTCSSSYSGDRWKNVLTLGVWGYSKLGSYHCTPAWETVRLSQECHSQLNLETSEKWTWSFQYCKLGGLRSAWFYSKYKKRS